MKYSENRAKRSSPQSSIPNPQSFFALIDCNNFYASCERVFAPHLEGKPIIVLSNNDGCIIARSNEAKKLKILMGAPFFQWKNFCVEHDVFIYSSNYELYGDMSHRVMTIIQASFPQVEIYSIDESFISLAGFSLDQFTNLCLQLRSKIKKYTGIPVSIGIGTTKTLAKIANYVAKTQETDYVFNINHAAKENVLSKIPLEKVWGIGRRLSRRFQQLNIHSAYDLYKSNPKILRAHSSVMVERIYEELHDVSCLPLEELASPRKQIVSSRSFGKVVTDLQDLEEAISHYTVIACNKLRKQHSFAAGISIFLHTNLFNEKNPQYGNTISFRFPVPTANTTYIIKIAKKCLRRIFKKGYAYQKTGIMLLDLSSASQQQQDFFDVGVNIKNNILLEAVDQINHHYGKNTIFYAAEGINKSWQIKRDYCSPRYTTCWNELLSVI